MNAQASTSGRRLDRPSPRIQTGGGHLAGWSFLLCMSLQALCPGFTHADIVTGLMARYPFTGNANDVSVNANHGTPIGGTVLTTDRFGTPNSAYQFNGLDSYIQVPNSASLNSPTTAMTQAAWISIAGPSQVGSGFDPIIMKSVTSENGFMYRMNATTTYFGAAFNDWNTHLSAGQAIPLNEWHHVAIVFNGTTIRFFFDGALVGTQPMALTIAPDTRPLTIGGDFPGAPEYFNGKIDDVALYSRALTDQDILELYSSTTGVQESAALAVFSMGNLVPNPTRGAVSIDFNLAAPEFVRLAVYDVSGRVVARLTDGPMERGKHTAQWDPTGIGNGVYFFRLQAAGHDRVAKVLVDR
jgi:hypothetical protein